MAWTLAELADICDGRIKGDPSLQIDGFASADEAGPGKLAFVTSAEWLSKLAPGAAAIMPPSLEEKAADIPGIVADEPRLAFAIVLNKVLATSKPEPGIHSTAVIGRDAQVDASAHVGAMAYVGPNSRIGPRTVIHPQAHIGEEAQVGADCALHPQCYVGPRCEIGDRVILGPGVSIGHDGFGYQWDGSRHVKIPQVGIVVIEDDVEIGALSAVDRATLGETRIGAGTKIDNLVMIGHNCKIGRNVILVAQVGLSGSVTIDDGAVLAGHVGVKAGVHIGAGALVAGKAGVTKDVPAGKRVWGTPARDATSWMRSQALLEKLPEIYRKVKKIEQEIETIEKGKETKKDDY